MRTLNIGELAIFKSSVFVEQRGRGDGGIHSLLVSFFIKSQLRVTAGLLFFPLLNSFNKAAIIVSPLSPSRKDPTVFFSFFFLSVFVCVSLGLSLSSLLNGHVRPVKTAPRKQHIPDESFNGGFTYQSDEKQLFNDRGRNRA